MAFNKYLDGDIFDAFFWFFVCILEISLWTYKTKLLKSNSEEDDNSLSLSMISIIIFFYALIKYFYFNYEDTFFIFITAIILFIISIYFKYFLREEDFKKHKKEKSVQYLTLKIIYQALITIIILYALYFTIIMIKYV